MGLLWGVPDWPDLVDEWHVIDSGTESGGDSDGDLDAQLPVFDEIGNFITTTI